MKKYVSKGGYAFKEFFKKHMQPKDAGVQKKSGPKTGLEPKHKPKSNPESVWVAKIRKYLQMENISFKEKFRRFPIDDERQYVPKFVLNNVACGTRHVVIDICEARPTEANTFELRSFIDRYETQYFVMLVVHDGYLREWNEYDQNRPTFDEIWTLDSIPLLANHLQSVVKRGGGRYVQKVFARCEPSDGCGKTASGHNEVEAMFGYQKNSSGEMAAHQYCRKCRKNTNQDEIEDIPDEWGAKNTYCTGCRSMFLPTSPSQSHCKSCLQEFRN